MGEDRQFVGGTLQGVARSVYRSFYNCGCILCPWDLFLIHINRNCQYIFLTYKLTKYLFDFVKLLILLSV